MARIKVELPEYFSVRHYKSMTEYEHLDELGKIVQTVVATTEHTEEEVLTWKVTDMVKVFKGIAGLFQDVGSEFYPVFEFKGIQYGFQPISKMTLGEWMDLDRRLEDPMENIEEILAILYRPITKHKFDDRIWKATSYIKRLVGKSDDLFKLYDLEEYDTETREWRTDIFQDLPIEYALGALSFFLQFGLHLQRDLLQSSPTTTEEMKKLMTSQINQALQSLDSSDGSTYYETWIQEES